MNKVLLFVIALAIGFMPAVEAQTNKKKSRQSTVKKSTVTETKEQLPDTSSGNTVSLTSVADNEARSSSPSIRLSISDPTINALNQRAAGNNVPISRSGIVGMPKRAYGFANGKILLRNTTAASPGTQYGSGAVGTGTTILGVGAGENTIGINGKNPYAGPSLWGSKLPNRAAPTTDPGRRQ